MIEASPVEEAKRLQADGLSQRAIAATIGKPRHWVRYQLGSAANAGLSETMDAMVRQLPLHLLHDSPHARPVNTEHVAALAKSISEIGLLEPVMVRRARKLRGGEWEDGYEIMAGLHRVEAARKLGRETISAILREADDLVAELVLIDENLCRRDLSPAERASAVKRRKALYLQLHPETAHGGDRKSEMAASSRQLGDLKDQKEINRFSHATAEATGIAERTVQRDAARGEQLGEDVLKKVIGTSLDKGEELDALAKLSQQKREALIERAVAGETVTAKPAVKQEKREEREAELGARLCALPGGPVAVFVEDFEWDYEPWSRETGMDRHAGNHYPVSEDAHTAAEIVARTADRFAGAADNCVVFMWAPVPHLAIAIDVLRLRGFRYVSNYVWAKDRIGTGHWNRNKHEHLLIGVKGNIPCPAHGTQCDSLITAAVGAHSAKPEIFLEMIEAYFPTLPKLELNRRGPARPGWKAWGNEAGPQGRKR
jgi:ParB/RepB/Spo0J family partition protein